jgi:hypothetical protein
MTPGLQHFTELRWRAFTDAELQLIADALLTTPHPRAYMEAMYGSAPADLATQIAAELARRDAPKAEPPTPSVGE